jgi:tetratricopeptide (TPR) repeat protein
LYLRSHPALSRLNYSSDQADRLLAMRLLNASRFHPLLMDRLAKLAARPDLKHRLLQALDTLEQSKGYSQLPELFATNPGDAKELAYLDDALATSLDQLLHDSSADARRLLWIIALANEPVVLDLLTGVWSGEEGSQMQQLRQIKQMLDNLPLLPPDVQEKLKALATPEVRAMLDALPPESAAAARPAIGPLLEQLASVGLATQEHTGPDDENPLITCHELVRERVTEWMLQHPSDQSGLTPAAIRLAYAERLEAVFNALRHQNMTAALHSGSQAIVYCVQAEAWDRLGSFASRVVTSSKDPRLLERLIPHLQTAAESAPEGRPRWSCLCYLADALRNGGRPDASLTFYEQAALQARRVAEAGGEDSRRAWSDLAWITGNQANALRDCGEPDAARQRRLDEAEANKKAGRPEINIIGSELEALRIDIDQGQVDTALPEVETRLARIETWWQQHRAGQKVSEAPDAEILSRAFITALDIARAADCARKDWASALGRLDAVLQVKRELKRPDEDIAATRMNRANVLGRLGRFSEAQSELEACLETFRNNPTNSAKVLSSLADLFDEQGDVPQAITQERRALAKCEQLPDPADRAISHNNLGNYLERSGNPSDLVESARRRDLLSFGRTWTESADVAA